MNTYWRKWFGWSWSRHRLWESCPRSYYFSYIGKWESGIEGRKCKMLSKLITLPMSVGGFVHDAIKQQLYHHSLGRPLSPGVAKRFFERMMADLNHNRKSLLEYYNNLELTDQAMEERKKDGLTQIGNFFNEVWPIYEKLEYVQHEEFEKFLVGKYTVWAVIDFISKDDDFYIVTDWKTGNPQEIQNIPQMKAYALWAKSRFDTTFDKIKTEVIFLREPEKPQIKSFEQEEMEAFEEQIISDCKLWDNVSSINDFDPKAESAKCQKCAFMTICTPGKDAIKK